MTDIFRKRKRHLTQALHRSSAALAFGAVFAAGTALAQAPAPVTQATAAVQSAAAVRAYWTPARLLSAKPMELTVSAGLQAADVEPQAGAVHNGAGAPPTRTSVASLAQRLHPAQALTSADDVAPANTSSFGAHFTNSRVFPDAATTTYPYRTVGKLFFTKPAKFGGGNFVCSASVIRPRVVATAGHCVFNGSPTVSLRGFYTNFLFVPAFRNGTAPLGSWTPAYLIVSGYWAVSGAVPNTQDVALMEMRDNDAVKIGTFTGWLGYQTGSLLPNHLHLIGYPCNLDSCQRMQQTTAQSHSNLAPNTVRYGSSMRGGASGGPWIKDFGVTAAGSPALASGFINQLKAVTSYGPTATAPKYLGASILLGNVTSGFLSMLNTTCAHRAGNC